MPTVDLLAPGSNVISHFFNEDIPRDTAHGGVMFKALRYKPAG